jgi:hypothetical protein
MQFTTKVPVPKSNNPIDYQSKILFNKKTLSQSGCRKSYLIKKLLVIVLVVVHLSNVLAHIPWATCRKTP